MSYHNIVVDSISLLSYLSSARNNTSLYRSILVSAVCNWNSLHEFVVIIYFQLYTVFRKNTHSHFLSYLHELWVDLNKNCIEYTQGMVDSDNVEIRYSLRLMT